VKCRFALRSHSDVKLYKRTVVIVNRMTCLEACTELLTEDTGTYEMLSFSSLVQKVDQFRALFAILYANLSYIMHFKVLPGRVKS
jgi:hypothetical protein